MMGTLLLASFLASQAAPVHRPSFQPRLQFKFQPAPGGRLAQRTLEDREIVCGTVVVHKSADEDPKILLPARDTGAVIRRFEPQACRGRTFIRPKK